MKKLIRALIAIAIRILSLPFVLVFLIYKFLEFSISLAWDSSCYLETNFLLFFTNTKRKDYAKKSEKKKNK